MPFGVASRGRLQHGAMTASWLLLVCIALGLQPRVLAVEPPCPPGSYQDSGACLQCASGFTCAGGLAAPEPCPAGTANDRVGSSNATLACVGCASGMYGRLAGQTTCESCPPGYACPLPDAEPTICGPGTFASVSASECQVRTAEVLGGEGVALHSWWSGLPVLLVLTSLLWPWHCVRMTANRTAARVSVARATATRHLCPAPPAPIPRQLDPPHVQRVPAASSAPIPPNNPKRVSTARSPLRGPQVVPPAQQAPAAPHHPFPPFPAPQGRILWQAPQRACPAPWARGARRKTHVRW